MKTPVLHQTPMRHIEHIDCSNNNLRNTSITDQRHLTNTSKCVHLHHRYRFSIALVGVGLRVGVDGTRNFIVLYSILHILFVLTYRISLHITFAITFENTFELAFTHRIALHINIRTRTRIHIRNHSRCHCRCVRSTFRKVIAP